MPQLCHRAVDPRVSRVSASRCRNSARRSFTISRTLTTALRAPDRQRAVGIQKYCSMLVRDIQDQLEGHRQLLSMMR